MALSPFGYVDMAEKRFKLPSAPEELMALSGEQIN